MSRQKKTYFAIFVNCGLANQNFGFFMMSWISDAQLRKPTQASLFSGMKLRSEIIEFFCLDRLVNEKNRD